jgi:beta-glucosidase
VTDRYDAVNWSAGLDLFRDGVLRIPQRDPVERPDLAGSFDMIGFSFYSTIGVRGGQVVPYPDGAPVSPLGYAIWADGLALVIDRLHERLPNTPLLVAEYGVGTSDDGLRADYLRRGLEITNQAIERGVDVRGFFHWTAVDNYEWLHGYDVSFGLIDRARVVRSSASVIAEQALS